LFLIGVDEADLAERTAQPSAVAQIPLNTCRLLIGVKRAVAFPERVGGVANVVKACGLPGAVAERLLECERLLEGIQCRAIAAQLGVDGSNAA